MKPNPTGHFHHTPDCPNSGGPGACSRRRCRVWHDLVDWFGLDGHTPLSCGSFEYHFTDMAHGGSGCYESLIVRGEGLMKSACEEHITKTQAEFPLELDDAWDAFDLPNDMKDAVPFEWARVGWLMKRVERVTSLSALDAFALRYLALGEVLPSAVSRARYVKACAGFACVRGAGAIGAAWWPCFLEHIYFSGRTGCTDDPTESELLWDLREVFGYKHTAIPRMIRNLFVKSSEAALLRASRNGERIIDDAIIEYGNAMDLESSLGGGGPLTLSGAVGLAPLFACVWFPSLKTALERWGTRFGGPPAGVSPVTALDVLQIFYGIVSCCAALSKSDECYGDFPIGLVHRMRQMQIGTGLDADPSQKRALRRRRQDCSRPQAMSSSAVPRLAGGAVSPPRHLSSASSEGTVSSWGGPLDGDKRPATPAARPARSVVLP